MSDALLNIKNLSAGVEGKAILKNLSLTINKGEVHVILGPNGSGKSTLMNVIMGHPKYEVTAGDISFEGKSLLEKKTFERAREGLFLSFQTPEEIPGITVGEAGGDGREGQDHGFQEGTQKDDGRAEDRSFVCRALHERGLFGRREEAQ